MPTVSILLPARDAAPTIEACLRSILRQRDLDWECVLVDDGSQDATVRVATALVGRDPRFHLLVEPRRGLVQALSRGLVACRGRYVARMDADDWMHRERLRDQVELLETAPGLDAAGTHVRLFPRGELGRGNRAYEAWLNSIDSPDAVRRELFVECPIAHPTLMVRREVLERFGYRDPGWPEDYDLLLRLDLAGRGIGVVPRRRLGWRHHARRLSRTAQTYRIERFTACKAEFLCRGLLADCERYVLWGYGRTGRAMRRALAAHGRHAAFVVELHPGRLGNRIHGAPVVRPEALADLPGLPLLASVAGAGPRRRIRAWLHDLGMQETVDFVCVA